MRDLVLAHRGRAEVDSQLGRGSTFTIHLPVATRAVGDPAAVPVGAPRPAAIPVVWELRGDIDLANAGAIQHELLRTIWSTDTDLVLDMSEVGVFGSSALAIVHAADTEIRARGGRLIVRGARPEVAELLAVVGIPGGAARRARLARAPGRPGARSLTGVHRKRTERASLLRAPLRGSRRGRGGRPAHPRTERTFTMLASRTRTIRHSRQGSNAVGVRRPSLAAVVGALLLAGLMALVGLTAVPPASGAPAPVFTNKAPDGAGFNITPGDLKFILKQIKISERHVQTLTADNPCGTLVGPGALQIPERRTPWGLRTVDGSCNNLYPGQERFAAADEPFPRLTTPRFKAAEGAPAGFFGPPPAPPAPTSSSYAQKKGNVFDSRPRTVSNLIVDQTSTNPAAVSAAGFPVRTQGNDGLVAVHDRPGPERRRQRADARLAHRERAGQPG